MKHLKINTAADLIEEIYNLGTHKSIGIKVLLDFINSEECSKKIINTRTFDGNTPIFIAASQSNFQVVNALIKKGADINVVVRSMTPLMEAIFVNNYEEENEKTINLLIEAGASLQPVEKQSAFNLACYFNKNQAIRKMLALGVDLEFRDKHDKTPVEYLKSSNNEQAIKMIDAYLLKKSLEKELPQNNLENKKIKV